MIISKGVEQVGSVTFKPDIEIESADPQLLSLLNWAIANPVPFEMGDEKDGVAITYLEYASLGDPEYPEAVSEFLAPYGYELLLKEMRLKGGGGSGNFGHEGRPGLVGGSSGDRTLPGAMVAGKPAREWFKQQADISEQLKAKTLAAYDKAKARGEELKIDRPELETYLDRMGSHRRLILDEGMDIAVKRKPSSLDEKDLMRRLMVHDQDKYDYKVAEGYRGFFTGKGIADPEAFKKAVREHHAINQHHPEYWVTGRRAVQMPQQAFWEMMADWRGTARERGTPYAQYYERHKKEMILHPRTREAVEFELGKLSSGLKEVAKRLKGGTGSGFFGHSGRPGAIGGSASVAITGSVAAKYSLPEGEYPVVWAGKPGAGGHGTGMSKLEKAGPGHQLVRVNGAYHVIKTPFTPAGGAVATPTVTEKEAAATPSKERKTAAVETAESLYETASESAKALARRTGVLPIGDFAEKYVREQVLPKVESGSIFSRDKVFAPKEMLGIKSPPPEERKAILDKYLKNWDSVEHGSFKGQVHNIFTVVHNEKTLKDYNKRVESVDNVKTGLYHGTHTEAAVSIASTGYLTSTPTKTSRMLGKALYLTDVASKSAQYVGKVFGRGTRDRGVMFENSVAAGKMDTLMYSDPSKFRGSGDRRVMLSDSIHTPKGSRVSGHGALRNGEMAVKDPKAVLPMYWLDVERIPK